MWVSRVGLFRFSVVLRVIEGFYRTALWLKVYGLGQSFGCLAVALMSLLEFRGLSKLDDPGESGRWILGFGLRLRVWGVRV